MGEIREFGIEKNKEIVKARILDDDLPEWIGALKDGGFTQEEIDMIVSRLNKTYLKENKPRMVERELTRLQKEFRKEYGRILTPEELDYLKAGIESRFKEKKE